VRKFDVTARANTPSTSKRRSPSEERPAKKRKTEAQEEVSDKATTPQSNGSRTRSGRARLPSIKMQEGSRRKRGRPRLPTPRRQVFAAAKPMKLKSLVVQSQPRDSNGRFGKKAETNGLYMRRRAASRNLGATARRLMKRTIRQQNTIERGILAAEDKQRAKYARNNDNNNGKAPQQKKLRHELNNPCSRSGSGPATHLTKSEFVFKNPGLSFIPNPINLSRRKWAPLISNTDPETILDKNNLLTMSETSEPFLSSTTHPPRRLKGDREKPNNRNLCSNISLMSLSLHPAVGALTHKPSPVTFARRRWMKGVEADAKRSSSVHDDSSSDSDLAIDFARRGSKSTHKLFPTVCKYFFTLM
jgi:[histone H4]-N-methyl-L-lysine20 N-methyltransferase